MRIVSKQFDCRTERGAVAASNSITTLQQVVLFSFGHIRSVFGLYLYKAHKSVKPLKFCFSLLPTSSPVLQTLDGRGRNMHDPDEIEDEQREREKRNKINEDFQQFVKKVQELWERDFPDLQMEFDIPFR